MLGVASCGFSTGDHVFYRVALEQTKQADDCFENGMQADLRENHTTSLRNGATYILYAPADGEVMLDTGSDVLGGDVTDTGYKFSGTQVDLDELGDDTTVTVTETITVDVTIDGPTVDGTWKSVTDKKCDGMFCDMVNTGTCTETTNFEGIPIDDANVSVVTAAPRDNR